MREKIILLIWHMVLLTWLTMAPSASAQQQYAEHSLLANGQWYKIPVPTAGVYKITTNEIAALQGIDCSAIAIYGDVGGMLSSNNTILYTDDMVPTAIEVVDVNQNGVFENGDYILFYGEGANVWRYNKSNRMFEFRVHAYANNNYYYLTTGGASNPSLRIAQQEGTDQPPFAYEINSHTGVALIHEDKINVFAGGRTWVDNKLSNSYNQRICNFTFPTTDGEVVARYGLANVSSSSATFTVSANNSGSTLTHRLNSGEDYQNFYGSFGNTSEEVTLTFTYIPQEINAAGYFDYVELNGTQRLQYLGGQCFFRNQQLQQDGAVCPFYFTGSSSNLKIWDVTNPCQPDARNIAATSDNRHYFTAPTDQARTFIAFTDADAFTPTGITNIDNQDIHGATTPDYVIVTHANYLSQANDLADLHRQHDGMNVLVVTQEQVYNEFSSGRPDPVAIRRMLRCLRNKSTNDTPLPRYLLLFGKGTYDNRDILQAHQTTVVTYQTANSFGDESSVYPSDDIYGYLDDHAVGDFEGSMSVGVGRLPAKNAAEASHMVDKISRYINRNDLKNSSVRGDWRNYVALLADDADPSCPYDSVFTSDSEITARNIKSLYPHFNIDRIYADAFTQQSGADGSYYPDVNNALRQRINYGCLLLNYIGHGSSSYIGTERFMEFSDIEKYTNTDQLTFFVTSTCSFGRYDHLQDICGAEAFLLAEAAGIGIVSASRPIHHTQRFNNSLCLYALNPDNSVGDALRLAKNGTSTSHSITLLGDPALYLSVPRNEVRVTHINQRPVDPMVTDSAEVLSRVTVEGDILAPDGSVLSDFNGTIYPIVFDREVKCRTLANDNDSTEVDFVQQKNILYKGRDNVTNGHFSYSFIVPRDVAYSYDYAKLSHYATNNVDNATGQYGNIMFGGFNDDLVITEFHPTVQLFINDTNFRNGGITNETPTLYARLSDSVGINAAGCGLGHDITAIIDGNPYSTVTLNDFYEPDINDSRQGKVRYTLGKLDEGLHTLTVKCWNIFNYSGSATISFRVANDRTAQIGLFTSAPNPASDRTTIRIEHNLPDQIASATLIIFDIRGRQLLQTDIIPSDGAYTLTYPWNFTTTDGTTLPKGIYIARCIITTTDGQTLSQNTKIVRN